MSTHHEESSLRFITCGSVDDGKSTLIGHLLYQTNNLYEDQIKTLEAESARMGNAGDQLDFSLLMDGLLSEREQGITIDVAYRYFNARGRKFIVADTPGHEQYTRNMATAASNCDAAIILVDSRHGVIAQTRRHALICATMGVSEILFAVNKMDLTQYSAEVFSRVLEQCSQIMDNLAAAHIQVPHWTGISVSALAGENLAENKGHMPWYSGPTVLDWLASRAKVVPAASGARLPVQLVIKPGLETDRWQPQALTQFKPQESENLRLYSGALSGGPLNLGQEIIILPSGLRSKVASIIGPSGHLQSAQPGQSIAVSLADKVDVSRGDGIFDVSQRPQVSNQFKVRVVWMQDDKLHAGRSYILQSAFGQIVCLVTKILSRTNLETYAPLASEEISKNDICELEISTAKPLPFDPYHENRDLGSFLLIDKISNNTAGAGMILHSLRRADNVHWHLTSVTKERRAQLLGQKPRLIWFTGFSGSGKSTIANHLEQELHAQGRHTMLLDSDNVRHGLNKDLGFSEQGRIENIRRVGEVAKLMVEAGLIVVACFISPYREDRRMVRSLFDPGQFIEVFVDTPIEECEARDPKGLYKKARAGAIPNFTGINAPYERPEQPEVVLDTLKFSARECALEVIKWLKA